jgi:D-amino-acid oxidase
MKKNKSLNIQVFKYVLILFSLYILNVNAINESIDTTIEIRKITPPKLDYSHIGQRIICYRPMRQGSPNMTIVEKDDKIIGHNYGHGGSGWTLAPGSASYVNNLFLEHTKNLTKDSPITILGAGALGLFTAYDFLQKGFSNIIIIADRFDSLTSHNAGGLLAPVSMDNDTKMQKIIDKIGLDSYSFYKSIAKKNNKDFKDGVIIVPTYFENRQESGLEAYVGKVMNPAKDVILDFGNGTTRQMVSYDDGIFIDTSEMMFALYSYLDSHGVKFIQKKINNFSEIHEKFIINCTGLGSSTLNNDSKMIPVQGHLIMLKEQNPKELGYMILMYFNEEKTKSGQKVKRSFYMFPKHLKNAPKNDIGVIGGTFIEGATHKKPNKEEFEIIIKSAKKFYGLF